MIVRSPPRLHLDLAAPPGPRSRYARLPPRYNHARRRLRAGPQTARYDLPGRARERGSPFLILRKPPRHRPARRPAPRARRRRPPPPAPRGRAARRRVPRRAGPRRLVRHPRPAGRADRPHPRRRPRHDVPARRAVPRPRMGAVAARLGPPRPPRRRDRPRPLLKPPIRHESTMPIRRPIPPPDVPGDMPRDPQPPFPRDFPMCPEMFRALPRRRHLPRLVRHQERHPPRLRPRSARRPCSALVVPHGEQTHHYVRAVRAAPGEHRPLMSAAPQDSWSPRSARTIVIARGAAGATGCRPRSATASSSSSPLHSRRRPTRATSGRTR